MSLRLPVVVPVNTNTMEACLSRNTRRTDSDTVTTAEIPRRLGDSLHRRNCVPPPGPRPASASNALDRYGYLCTLNMIRACSGDESRTMERKRHKRPLRGPKPTQETNLHIVLLLPQVLHLPCSTADSPSQPCSGLHSARHKGGALLPRALVCIFTAIATCFEPHRRILRGAEWTESGT